MDGPTLLDNGILVTGSSGGYVLGIQSNGNHLNDRVPWPKYKHDLRNTSNPLTPIRDSNPPLAVGEPQPGAGVELAPPAPNPVLRSARISLALARATRVTLAVHDLAGRRVRTLASGTLAAGIHQCLWDRTDDGGRAVPPGVYRVRASAGALVRSRSIVVL
uniref:FlgD/Vpr Ig-like domain-containing protein n=1 Tax=Eiseniibacteriota bacterium TaxID=2212470 RepID=A0A832I060_UNCEI